MISNNTQKLYNIVIKLENYNKDKDQKLYEYYKSWVNQVKKEKITDQKLYDFYKSLMSMSYNKDKDFCNYINKLCIDYDILYYKYKILELENKIKDLEKEKESL